MDPADTIPVPKEISLRVLRALRRRKDLWRFLSALCRAAEAAGGSPYLVGGFVRDLIEGRPGKDIDLMLTGIRFDALGKIVRGLPKKELGIRRVVVAGKQFAVYKVRFGPGRTSTLRSRVPSSPPARDTVNSRS
jgi:tRNA nucleotidyltransferase/poly(A) polymerase